MRLESGLMEGRTYEADTVYGSRIAGGVGHRAAIGADKQVDLVLGGQLLDGGDALLRVGSVAARSLMALLESYFSADM